jgi:hypothetical protein
MLSPRGGIHRSSIERASDFVSQQPCSQAAD